MTAHGVRALRHYYASVLLTVAWTSGAVEYLAARDPGRDTAYLRPPDASAEDEGAP